jgi:hypothetical protein
MQNRRACKIAVAVSATILFQVIARADTITMKSGAEYEGMIASETNGRVNLEMHGSTLSLPASKIKSIKREQIIIRPTPVPTEIPTYALFDDEAGVFIPIRVTIEISGDKGIAFSGHCSVHKIGGPIRSKSISGVVPMYYTTAAGTVSIVIQKSGGRRGSGTDGKLKVRVLRGLNVIGESETDAADGVVTIAGE